MTYAVCRSLMRVCLPLTFMVLCGYCLGNSPISPAAAPPLDDARARTALAELRTLRTELAKVNAGQGRVAVQSTSYSSQKSGGLLTEKRAATINFAFLDDTTIARVIDANPANGLVMARLETSAAMITFSRQTEIGQGGKARRFFHVTRDTPDVKIPDGPQISVRHWNYHALTAVPNGWTDDKLFQAALGPAGSISRNGDELTLVYVENHGGPSSRIHKCVFNLKLGGVITDFEERDTTDPGTRWSWHMKWRLDGPVAVPMNLNIKRISVGSSGNWVEDRYQADFLEFKLAAPAPADLTVRALKITPGTLVEDKISKKSFVYGEANWLKATGHAVTETPMEEKP